MEDVFGPHQIRVEGDIAVIVFNGDLTAEDAHKMFAVFEAIVEQYGRYGTLVDARRMGRVTQEARGVVAQWPYTGLTFGTSVFGASLATRTVMTLVIRALQLIGRGPLATEFFPTQAQAQEWIRARSKEAAAAQQAALSRSTTR